MSDFKLEFTLKQHTPIIHFQARQKGATLRATELKPKLDQFLNTVLDSDEISKYFLPGEAIALDYQVKIEEKAEEDPYRATPNDKLYLGNMGGNNIEQKFLKNGSITITFKSFHTQLLEHIKNNFPLFLFQTNFGSRQSKGFGSFYLYDEANKTYTQPDLRNMPYRVYKFKSIRGDYENDIALFYAMLRSGINYPCTKIEKNSARCPDMRLHANNRDKGTHLYVKSVLYHYLNDNTEITWDKRAIKNHFFLTDTDTVNNATLARDLFGLSSPQAWKSYDNAELTKKHTRIARFKSPIVFKPLIDEDIPASLQSEVTVYFWANNTYIDMLDKEFKVSVTGKNNLTLSTPQVFSFDDFFTYLISDYGFRVDPKYNQTDEYKTLQKIMLNLEEVKV